MVCYDLQNSSHSLATQVQLIADKPICFLKDLKQELDKSYRERLGSSCYWWPDMLQEKSASPYALLRTRFSVRASPYARKAKSGKACVVQEWKHVNEFSFFLSRIDPFPLKSVKKKTFPERKRGVEQAPVDFEYVGKMEKAWRLSLAPLLLKKLTND